jgi:type IV secretion system protein VirB8
MNAWISSTLSDDARSAFLQAARDRQASAEKDTRMIRRIGLIGAVGGTLAGLLGVTAALVVYLKTPVPEPPGYVLMDRTTGWISEAVGARDAPKLFPVAVRERAMRDFLLACESYIPATWVRIDWHACMIQASADEQKRLAAEIGRDGPRYPVKLFGPAGWAMPTRFDDFRERGQSGTEPNIVWDYQVRYVRTELANGREVQAPYTALMTFTFHPELKMTQADRLINPSGLQVLSFSTVRD